MIGILYIATWVSPYFTTLAVQGGVSEAGQEVSSLWAGNVFDFIIANLGFLGYAGLGILVIITIGLMVFVKKYAMKE